MRLATAAILLACVSCPALGQELGTVTITADGAPVANVLPGTTVSIGVRVSYHPMALQLASIAGAVRVEGDAGVGSNFVFNLGFGPQHNYGTFQGGSRVGMDLSSPQPIFFGIHPLWSQNPVSLLTYDLTLDDPGSYTVEWEFPASSPGIALYFPSIIIPPQGNTLTQSATITVLPAPAGIAAIGAGLTLPRRRRP